MIDKKLLSYFNGDDLAASTWKNKYAIDGEVTPDDMHRRMAIEIARIENKYSNAVLTEDNIYNLFKDFKYIIPAGSVMATLGKDSLSSLSNCFVIDGPEDSISSIMNQCNNQAQLMKYRGGVGFDISKLRPSGATVKNSAKSSTGAASFMDLFSNVTNTIAQNGRRGALMLTMDINHPDIEEFITKKQDLTKVTGANVSILISDEFMTAVEHDCDYILSWPTNIKNTLTPEEVYIEDLEYNVLVEILPNIYFKRIKAKDLWDKIILCAWNTAEPGLLFIDRIHNYSPDGDYVQFRAVSTNPCGEIPMGPYDSCRLIHLNLISFIDKAYTNSASLNEEELYYVSYLSMKIADNLVDLEIESINKILNKVSKSGDEKEYSLWNKIKSTALEGRRTGLGFTGLADMLAMMSLQYGSKESLVFIEKVMTIMFKAQLDCTIDLSIDRGSFIDYIPGFNETNSWYKFIENSFPDEYQRMQKYGRRNVSFNTVAPTGTVSIMAGTSSGIEPIFSAYYKRKRKCSSPNDRVDFIDAMGEKFTEFFVLHHEFKKWCISILPSIDVYYWGKDIEKLNSEELDKAFKLSPWNGSSSSEIEWENRIELQSVVQKYTTHAISSTLNLPKSYTQKQVSDIYFRAWSKGLKGVTIYRDGSRDGVLNIIEDESTPGKRQVIKRPKVLEADYYQVKSKGTQYIVIVGLLDNKPYEVFTFQPNLEVDFANHKGLITKVKKGHYTYDSPLINIANLELSTDNIEEKACSLYTSMLLRHNADIKFIIKTAKKINDNISSFSSAMCRVLSKYTETEEIKGEKCPECGGRLIRESGCIKCLDCDYSKCL